MTAESNPQHRARRLAARLVLAAATLSPVTSPAQEWGLDQLMQTLTRNASARATFTEKKYITILDRPIESAGELVFVAPDRLEKRTLRPRPESLVLDSGVLTVEQANRRLQISIDDYPEVAAFVESIRGTLAGDRKALERVYRLDLSGTLARWSLGLTPLEPRLQSIVASIRISGAGADVHTVEIRQADGDRSVMTVERAAAPVPARPATP